MFQFLQISLLALCYFPYNLRLLCCAVLSRFSRVWLSVTPWTIAPGSSVHGTLQARILEWVAVRSSRGASQPRDQIQASSLLHSRRILYHQCHVGSPNFCLLLNKTTFLILKTVPLLTEPKNARRLPRWHSGKESTCQCRRCGFDPWVRKTPWRRKQEPTPVFLPEESHGQRSLVSYSPWGHKESDVTELLTHTDKYVRSFLAHTSNYCLKLRINENF